MFPSKRYFFLLFIIFLTGLFTIPAPDIIAQGQTPVRNNGLNGKSNGGANSELPRLVLAITPRELDVGTIGPGDSASGTFTFKNMGSGIMNWSTRGPEGWKSTENQKLSSVVEDDADYLRFEIRILPNGQTVNGSKTKKNTYLVEMKLEAGSEKLICQNSMSAGMHKEAIKVTSAGGSRTIFVTFKLVSTIDLPQINLNPVRMDMGYVPSGKIVSRKIRLTNKGKEMLKWSVAVQKQKKATEPANFRKGRYISLVNEEVRGSSVYSPPGYLKDSIDMSGRWTEVDGYPSGTGGGNSLKLRFNGTGLSIYLTTYPENGNLAVYLDEHLMNDHDWFTDQKEVSELLVAENLVDGPHVMTLVNKEGHIDIEGIKIFGKDPVRGPSGWLTIFPDSGTTTLETEYINVNLNTAQLASGLYSDNIIINSNGGEGIVEVYVDVIQDKLTKTIDIYRFAKDLDYLFTADPQSESKRLKSNAYMKEGIAFRLFVSDTPGTTNFYRWYNPQKKDHFYHYDPKGGGKQLQGYVFEGSIGNIATSRMTNTRELYRWFNPATGHYFYTTDQKGEAAARKKYRFDGIAGYVK